MESVSKIKNNLAFDALISFEQDDAVLRASLRASDNHRPRN